MRRFLFITFFILVCMAPFSAFAQTSGPLVPCNGPECEACDVVKLGQNIINFLVGIAAFIGMLVFAWGGFLMVTAAGNASHVAKAHEMFTSALVGLLIVLAGWLIIDTVMKHAFVGSALERDQSGFGPWNQIQCVPQPVFVREGTAPGAINIVNGEAKEGTYTQAQAESILRSAGVDIHSSGNCTDPANKKCTSLAGMREDTVNQVLKIKEACSACRIIVTGGTETGHAGGATSHGEGYKIDIDDGNQALNTYLERTLIRDGSRGGAHGGARYRDACGNEYVRESSHWDISVTNGSCSL